MTLLRDGGFLRQPHARALRALLAMVVDDVRPQRIAGFHRDEAVLLAVMASPLIQRFHARILA